MGLIIHFFQLFECGVRIDLGCLEVGMSEQIFHTFQVGSVVEHGRGEGMAQHVRASLFLCRHACHVFLHLVAYLTTIHALAVFSDEERLSVPRHNVVSHRLIGLQRRKVRYAVYRPYRSP